MKSNTDVKNILDCDSDLMIAWKVTVVTNRIHDLVDVARLNGIVIAA